MAPSRSTSAVPGFSLLELMIAIMILGIGVVMVATIFPVGLEMSRDTIQKTLAASVAESAANTLLVKVPPYDPIDDPRAAVLSIPLATPRVLVPDVVAIELGPQPADMTVIDAKDREVLSGSAVFQKGLCQPDLSRLIAASPPEAPVSYPILPNPVATFWTAVAPNTNAWVNLKPDTQIVPEYIDHTRLFTARTGWTAEMNGFNYTAVMPTGNLPADLTKRDNIIKSLVTGSAQEFRDQIPVMVLPTIQGAYQPDLPRVNLVDQVYPPVELINNADHSERNAAWILDQLFSRRYMWMAFQHRISKDVPPAGKLQANRDLMASVAVLHRADLYARFPRQVALPDKSPNYYVHFDLTKTEHRKALLCPRPDTDPLTDAVFPRPWLALVHINYDPTTSPPGPTPQPGTVTCSAEVARLLPAGSYFIIAQTNGGYYAGTAIEVLKSEWSATNLGSSVDPDASPSTFPWSQLQIPRTNKVLAQNVLVWVFPPAITRTSPVEFQTRSPLISVAMRRIPIQ